MLIDVHDSGPGLSEAATLFEPTITFKQGMGLGLSIAKKNALLSGGDVTVIPGELGALRSRYGCRHDAQTAHRHRRRAEHRPVASPDPGGRGLPRQRVRIDGGVPSERHRAAADVYLLDVRLPDGSGIDLLRLVRQWDERHLR